MEPLKAIFLHLRLLSLVSTESTFYILHWVYNFTPPTHPPLNSSDHCCTSAHCPWLLLPKKYTLPKFIILLQCVADYLIWQFTPLSNFNTAPYLICPFLADSIFCNPGFTINSTYTHWFLLVMLSNHEPAENNRVYLQDQSTKCGVQRPMASIFSGSRGFIIREKLNTPAPMWAGTHTYTHPPAPYLNPDHSN